MTNYNDIYKLRTVSFKYKEEILQGNTSLQYGLIAEEVEKVNPHLIAYGKDGEIFTFKYHFITSLMLSVLQKEHQ